MAASIFQRPPSRSLLRDCRNHPRGRAPVGNHILYNMIRHFSDEPLRDTVDIFQCLMRIHTVIRSLCRHVPFTFRTWGEYQRSRSGWGPKPRIELQRHIVLIGYKLIAYCIRRVCLNFSSNSILLICGLVCRA